MPSLRTVLLGVVAAAALSVVVLPAEPAAAYQFQSKIPVNVDKAGLALRGYDPVAYFTLGKPTRGDAKFSAVHDGFTYRFATAEHQATFTTEPAKHVPSYGGYCAWAASQGYKADADPNVWRIVDGRLFVNYNAAVGKSWAASAPALIQAGDATWSKVRELPAK